MRPPLTTAPRLQESPSDVRDQRHQEAEVGDVMARVQATRLCVLFAAICDNYLRELS